MRATLVCGNNLLLKNVLSSMVHLKQANDACETLLTRFVQPLDAFRRAQRAGEIASQL